MATMKDPRQKQRTNQTMPEVMAAAPLTLESLAETVWSHHADSLAREAESRVREAANEEMMTEMSKQITQIMEMLRRGDSILEAAIVVPSQEPVTPGKQSESIDVMQPIPLFHKHESCCAKDSMATESLLEKKLVHQQMSHPTEALTHLQVSTSELELGRRSNVLGFIVTVYENGNGLVTSTIVEEDVTVVGLEELFQRLTGVKLTHGAHHLLEKMSHLGKTRKQLLKKPKFPKSWNFKYKNKTRAREKADSKQSVFSQRWTVRTNQKHTTLLLDQRKVTEDCRRSSTSTLGYDLDVLYTSAVVQKIQELCLQECTNREVIWSSVMGNLIGFHHLFDERSHLGKIMKQELCLQECTNRL